MEQDHFWFVARRRVIADAMARLPLPPGARVLDAGCGTGANIASLRPEPLALGVDPVNRHLSRALTPDGPRFVRGDITSLALRRDSIDLAMALDVLEHVDDLAALTELRRVVKGGGRVIITVPAMPSLWRQRDNEAGHLRRYTRRSLIDVATRTGLRIDRCVPFNSLLVPLVAASRLAETRPGDRRPNRSNVNRENNPSGLVNKALTAVSLTEARLIGKGLRPPIGTSLLAVLHNPGRP